jgi:pilus assembly protein CpaE
LRLARRNKPGSTTIHRISVESFLVADETAKAVETALTDRRLVRARLTLRSGGVAAAVEHYREARTPEVLIVETTDEHEALLACLDALAGVCEPTTKVIVLGAANDVNLYRTLRKQGVSEYLPLPADAKHISEAIATLTADDAQGNLGRLITFIGAGGGVGSSQIAHNTAFQISRLFDAETAVLDLDLGFGTVSLDYNLESPQSIASVLAEHDRLDDSLVQRAMAKYNENLYLLTAPNSLAAFTDVPAGAIEALLRAVRRNASFVVVDLPGGWNATAQHVLNHSDEIVVTATPRLHALRNAKQIVDLVAPKRTNDAPVRVILNKVGAHAKTELSAKDFVTALEQPPALVIPNDPAVFELASNNGAMIGEVSRCPKIVDLFERLALLVSGRQAAKPKRSGFATIFKFPQAKKRA